MPSLIAEKKRAPWAPGDIRPSDIQGAPDEEGETEAAEELGAVALSAVFRHRCRRLSATSLAISASSDEESRYGRATYEMRGRCDIRVISESGAPPPTWAINNF